MTRSPLWREFESSDNFLVRLMRVLILVGGITFMLLAGTLDLTWPQQLWLGLLIVLIAIWIDRASTSYLVTLTLILLSCFSTFRYGFWRIEQVFKFFQDPGNHWTVLDVFFILLLVAAEAYAFTILFLGYLQTLWPLRRTPVPLPEDTDLWPEVDLLIPTYNEPLSVVKFTALAAMNIDWPADKLNVYILDDGKREEFRAFAEEAGIGYMTRDDNQYAKAGNINRALTRLEAPFVAIFDSDHVPTRSFLQLTMGWFLRDAKLGVLQTPHHFYSPDPFERNLGQFRTIPNEGELFYGVVQDGNDFWNASFFCGSCAVLRREALDEIGGIAVETVTEDAHTSLRMQIRGWNTAYINIPQAAGLATERLSGHVKQRIRWARGMVQILRIENPLLAPGLSPAQRLCYFNAMTHFLYALPRLIFLTAPLIYLILGHTNVPGFWAAILAYAFPHLILSFLTNSRIQGQHRHSFWNEIYETVLAPYIFIPTMLALFNPRAGAFNVTAKGGVVSKSYFDARIAQPYLVLLFLNIIGLLCAIPRYLPFPHIGDGLPWPISAILNIPASMYDGNHAGTILMNVLWTFFNLMILSVGTAVAWEQQQRRQTVRVMASVPAGVILPDGSLINGMTADISSGGVMLNFDERLRLRNGEKVQIVFPVLDGDASLPATVVGVDNKTLRAHFDPLTTQEEEALTMVLYSRADTWLGWGEAREADKPLLSMWRIMQLSIHGLAGTIRGVLGGRNGQPRGKVATSIAPVIAVLLALLGMLLTTHNAGAQTMRRATPQVGANGQPLTITVPTSVGVAANQARPVAPGTFDNQFSLSDTGVPTSIVMRGVDSYHSVYFSVPHTELVKSATMKLVYQFSPGLLPSISHLKVSLNGTPFATVPVTTQPVVMGTDGNDLPPDQKLKNNQAGVVVNAGYSPVMTATITVPAELMVHDNELTFEFVGHYTLQCEDPSHSTLWAEIAPTTTLELAGSMLPLQNDLKSLPLPFYDKSVNLHPTVPVVFLTQPSAKAMQAAGVVASWFGMMTNYQTVRFPVTFGTIPQGNAIVISEDASSLPPELSVSGSSGPTIAMKTNPNDPYSKVLVLTGGNADDLLTAAQALVLQSKGLAGASQGVVLSEKPKQREPDDAPRWLSTAHITNLGQIAQQGDLQGDGTVPVAVYSRTPPDLYYGDTTNLAYHMDYRYNGIPLASESSLQVFQNGAFVSSTPLPHTDTASKELSTVIPVPVVDMRPFSNTMMMKFIFQIAKKGKCEDTAPMNLQGSVLRSSYLDITDIPHWIQLPNLEVFSNAGYPFTRRADLSDTAVVLPDAPSAEELELYLMFMGHFGAQTGYPVLNVTVTNADGMKGDKDFLVLGTVDDQPAIGKLNNKLPVAINSGGLKIQDTGGFFDSGNFAWWKVRSSDRVDSGKLETSGGLPDAMIEGIESPYSGGRSVVVVALKDKSVVPNFVDTFLKTSQSSDIQKSVSVLDGQSFTSYQLGSSSYHVGSLSWWTQLRMIVAQYPWLIVLVLIVVVFLMAALLRALLRRHARRRLQVMD
jgi:cellulose synthase (UDP-forming)